MTPAKKVAVRRTKAKPGTRGAKGKGPAGADQATPHWDIADIDRWGPDRHEPGATIPEAGNSVLNETGGWRTFVPVIDSEKCVGCLLCYFYCPDASIIIERGVATGVDLAHCKGCGICARECPVDAIEMILEEKE